MALIITIIILIILAAISISAIVGTNMVNTAVAGTDNYVEAGELENKIMQNTVDYLDSVVASMTGESGTGGSSGFTDEEKAELIGKYVAYTPDSGTYDVVTKNSTYTGSANNTSDFATDKDLNWQIWSITDDELILISDTTAQNGGYYYDDSAYGWCLYLSGNLGYNNGVKILNDICKTCYSSSSVNGTGVEATARSLNIQDIEEVLDWSVWAPTSYTAGYGYAYTSTKQYTDSNYRYYPGLWPQEDYANIDGVTVKNASYTYDSGTGTLSYSGSGLRRSDQTTFCTDTYGYADTYIEPTQTHWLGRVSVLASAWADSEYASLVNCGKYYWMASRSVSLSDAYAFFGLSYVRNDGWSDSTGLFGSSGGTGDYNLGVRPVVMVPLTSLTLDLTSNTGETSDDAYEIVAK